MKRVANAGNTNRTCTTVGTDVTATVHNSTCKRMRRPASTRCATALAVLNLLTRQPSSRTLRPASKASVLDCTLWHTQRDRVPGSDCQLAAGH
jgi:hypothetical protein